MNIITIPYGGNHFKVHSLLYLNNRIQVFYLEKKDFEIESNHVKRV